MKSIYTLVFVAAVLAACGSKKKDDGAGSAGSAATAPVAAAGSDAGTGSAGSAAAAAEAPVDVPTEVDFESQANTDITDKNVEAKLKELEGELPQ